MKVEIKRYQEEGISRRPRKNSYTKLNIFSLQKNNRKLAEMFKHRLKLCGKMIIMFYKDYFRSGYRLYEPGNPTWEGDM